MKTIYLVSQGEYSDYHVCGVFSSQEKAQLYIDRFGSPGSYEEMSIQEYELDSSIDEIKSGLTYFSIRMQLNGDGAYTNTPKPEKWDKDRLDIKRNYFFTCCWAKDETHAIKIANERRIQALATQNG